MSSTLEPDETVTLIDELLTEQRSLTAAACFSRLHEQHGLPSQERYYRDLIPLSQPGPGEQYAFEVDLDQCSGCKGCVTACHALNGLDDDEAWRDVGLLLGDDGGHVVQQTVTTACHHCVDPGCLNGCPVLAYEKDPLTGIVRHLDDQCIGCQYCVMKCPYDVPKYSERLGIVRKCDMCSQRLSEGEAPACVQACPTEAIKITVVNQDRITARYRNPDAEEERGYSEPDFNELAAELSQFDRTNNFLPSSPDPNYTLPTTRFKTSRPHVTTLHAANESALKPQHAHWPLIFLLVLSQASVGLGLVAALLGSFDQGSSRREEALVTAVQSAEVATSPELGRPRLLKFESNDARTETSALLIASATFMAIALCLATFHLGRPMKAWRVFLGWRTSWFSREAIAFGGYMNVVATAAGLAFFQMDDWLRFVLPVAALLGVVSVFSSLMLYVDTRREFWSAYHTGVRFAGTTVLLGFAGWLIVDSRMSALSIASLWIVLSLSLVKIALEATVMIHARSDRWTPLKRTTRLMVGPLRPALGFRVFALLLGGLMFPALALIGMIPMNADLPLIIFVALLAGELAERFLFFTAVSPTQMPGGIHS